MKTIVKLLLILCIILLEDPITFSCLWWLCIGTFVLSIIVDVIDIVKLTKDNE